MNVRSRSVIIAFASLLSATSPVLAQSDAASQKKKALEMFDKGKVQYDLGRWQQAVDLWMQAYETFNAPEFLFNIAQAHRHQGDCERSIFFYRRYLAMRPNAGNRGEVEKIISELEVECKAKEEAGGSTSGKPGGGGTGPTGAGKTERGVPDTGDPGESDGSGGRSTGRDVADAGSGADGGDIEEEEGDVEDTAEPIDQGPRIFALRVAVGPSFASLGPLEVGTLVSLTAGISHPLHLGQIVLEPGALVTYSPLPWEVQANQTEGTAGLTGLLANLGAGYEFIPNLSGRADIGVGALIFSGLTKPGNPFLDMRDIADGPIPLFHVRGALGVEYAITPNLVIQAQPAVFSYSPSRPLREDIDSITRFELLVGAGYRM